jgi:DNA mismatch repair protein MSH5
MLLSRMVSTVIRFLTVVLMKVGETRYPPAYQFDLRPNPEFSYQDALSRLLTLPLSPNDRAVRFLVPGDGEDLEANLRPDEIGLTSKQGELMNVSTVVDLNSTVSVGCIGAIVAYLQRKRGAEYLSDDPNALAAYRITGIAMFTLKNTMYVPVLYIGLG